MTRPFLPSFCTSVTLWLLCLLLCFEVFRRCASRSNWTPCLLTFNNNCSSLFSSLGRNDLMLSVTLNLLSLSSLFSLSNIYLLSMSCSIITSKSSSSLFPILFHLFSNSYYHLYTFNFNLFFKLLSFFGVVMYLGPRVNQLCPSSDRMTFRYTV